MHEVKSKATEEKVERTFKFNNDSADQKTFVVVLPRSCTLNIHPVYVVEIDTAKPKLCETNCNNEQESTRLRAHVTLKITTKESKMNMSRPPSCGVC